MSKLNPSYSKLSSQNKLKILTKLYVEQNKSFADIAVMFDTYPNKIRRDAKALGLPVRNKSEAQKNALNNGKHKHPTKGTQRSEETKVKIGYQVMRSWESLSDQELEARKDKARQNWDNMDIQTKQNIHQKAIKAVRLTSKTGSKLEKFLLKQLISDKYVVEFHKEQSLVNTKLQIDLFLPKLSIAIEVDGPSHFEPVWGKQSLQRNISYDQKKEGLITGKGWHLIRIRQTKDFSKARSLKIYDQLIKSIRECESSKVSKKINIED
jgi:very-short-patch-repair endonuclease